MSRTPLENRTIWITGASSGIGLELTRLLAAAGNRLILTGRNRTRLMNLQELDRDRIDIVDEDISMPDAHHAMARRLGQYTDHLDTVILNAGTCEYIDVDNFDMEAVQRVVDVNLLGFSRCLWAALPLLKKSSHDPHLVGVSSAAAIRGLPRAEIYGATKAGVSHFLEALRLDLGPHGIDVSTVLPGFVDTPLTRRNDFPMPFLLDGPSAAQKIIDGIERRHREIAFPRKLLWPLRLLSALPVALSDRIAATMVRQTGETI